MSDAPTSGTGRIVSYATREPYALVHQIDRLRAGTWFASYSKRWVPEAERRRLELN